MSAKLENISLDLKNNLSNLNATFVEEESNNGRASPSSEPKAPSPFQSFLQGAKQLGSKVSKVFQRPSTPSLPFEEIQGTPLYMHYENFLVKPSSRTLQHIQKEVQRLGVNSPIVQTLRSYAEGVFENAAYVGEAKKEQALVNALKGSTLSFGGKRSTRKQKRVAGKRKRSTRK